MRHVLAIAGSLRRGSFNRSLLRAAAELAPPRLAVAVEDDLASVPLFDEDLESATAGGPGSVARLRAKVASADGLLIATPEYNQSIPGVLKNAIDWLSRDAAGEVLAGKPVAIVGASSGPWGTRLSQAALRQVLYATGSPVLPGPALYLRDARRLFDDAGRLTDASTRERLAAVLAAFDRWMDRLATGGARA